MRIKNLQIKKILLSVIHIKKRTCSTVSINYKEFSYKDIKRLPTFSSVDLNRPPIIIYYIKSIMRL